MNDSAFELPRKDLRIDAFRKYERFIADACMRDIIVDPGKKSAATWIARFNDARRGYMIYKYKSDLIPPNYNLSNLRAVELSDGTVKIKDPLRETNQISVEALFASLPSQELKGVTVEIEPKRDL